MYKLIRTLDELKLLELDDSKPIFCDTETCEDIGLSSGGLYGKIRLFQIFQAGWDNAQIIDCIFIPLDKVLDKLKQHHLVFHNVAYDVHVINLYTDSTWMPAILDDTLYLSRLTFFDKAKFDFYSCLKYCKESDYIISGIDKSKNQKADWDGVLSNELFIYAACDVIYLEKLWNHVQEARDTHMYKLDMRNFTYAVDYDRHGIPINRKTISKMTCEFMLKAEEVMEGLPVNPNSSKQCCDWLGTSSSDATVLGTLALQGDDRAQAILDARHYTKGLQFMKKYDRDVMYGFHNPCGAITGRFSCSGGDRYDHENTQQPPKYLFPAIEAPEGKTIIYKDYSGLELRLAVAYVGEPTMAHMMKEGLDLHTHTGCRLFDCTPETLPKEKRTITKFYNFGTIYGAYPKTLQGLLQSQGRIVISLDEVTMLREKWLDMYHYFREWHQMFKRVLNVYGYIDIDTCLGRKIRAYALNDALNFPIQGSACEVTKTAVDLLMQRHPDAYVINVVHDSMGLMHDEDEAEVWKDRLNSAMIDAWYEVIKNLVIPDLPMPPEARITKTWPY